MYLDPSSAKNRDAQIRKLHEAYDDRVHNIVAGDFNFTTSTGDRIKKNDAECHENETDQKNAATWKMVFDQTKLKEFAQEGFTCENSFGWSRIDRIYTNLHSADLILMKTVCHVISHPRYLSDHTPLSMTISRPAGNYKKPIPVWVTEDIRFKSEFVGELETRCFLHKQKHGHDPTPFERFSLIKESAIAASKYIMRCCRGSVAKTAAHRLAGCLSFIKAINDRHTEQTAILQRGHKDLKNIALNGNTMNS